MRTGKALLAIAFASASLTVCAQQPAPPTQPGSPATSQPGTPQTAQPMQQQPASAAPEAAASAMSPVKGELLGKLDTKTAKTGDSVEVRTKANVKTADGIDIPKGSKLIGKVVAVQSSASGTNSQVALQFDHIELKGGQSLPVQSQIESISPAGAGDSAAADTMAAGPSGSSGRAGGSAPMNGTAATPAPGTAPQTAAAAGGMPAAGTIVAKNGNIAIQTTSIPGILLANNAPGMHDPRMAQASSILLGAKRDVELDGGTLMVLDVAAASGGAR